MNPLLELQDQMGKREFRYFMSMVLHAEGRVLPMETPISRFSYGVNKVFCNGVTYDFSTCRKDKEEFKGNVHILAMENGKITVKDIDINGGTTK